MAPFQVNAMYEPAEIPGDGLLHITWDEEEALPPDVFGEIVSARPKRRRKKIVLKVRSNIVDLSGLAPWERELLGPVVTRLMHDVLRDESDTGESSEGSPRQEED